MTHQYERISRSKAIVKILDANEQVCLLITFEGEDAALRARAHFDILVAIDSIKRL